jgi:sec-independent protein translocase protein TatA
MFLLIFESIGAPELLVILVVALIIFGPRKLPQLAQSLGRSLSEFRRASDEFKRTWEREVEMEAAEMKADISRLAALPEDNSILGAGEMRTSVVQDGDDDEGVPQARGALNASPSSTALNDSSAAQTVEDADAPRPEPTRKRDWL